MKSKLLKITLGVLWTIIIVFLTFVFSYYHGFDSGYKQAKVDEFKTSIQALDGGLEDVNVSTPSGQGSENVPKETSEEEAMAFIKDNYSFYEKHIKTKDIQLRRVNANTFDVSVNECDTNVFGDLCDRSSTWDIKIRRLRVYENDKYDYD